MCSNAIVIANFYYTMQKLFLHLFFFHYLCLASALLLTLSAASALCLMININQSHNCFDHSIHCHTHISLLMNCDLVSCKLNKYHFRFSALFNSHHLASGLLCCISHCKLSDCPKGNVFITVSTHHLMYHTAMLVVYRDLSSQLRFFPMLLIPCCSNESCTTAANVALMSLTQGVENNSSTERQGRRKKRDRSKCAQITLGSN